MNRIHISTAIHMLESPEPVSLTVLTTKGESRHYDRVIGLKRQHYAGSRNIKILPKETNSLTPKKSPLNQPGEIRKIRDCLILAVNGIEVFY